MKHKDMPTQLSVSQNTRIEELEAQVRVLQIENARMELQLRMDDLTGLYNAKFLKQQIDRVLEKRLNHSEAPALLFLDIDHFKEINESHGHAAAGSVLSQMGQLLSESIREEDIGFRYGGDEFVILVSGGTEGAMQAANRLRQLIEQHKFPVNGLQGPALVQITVSVGIRVMSKGDSALSVLEAADKAMFEAKRRSRNACVAA